MLGSEGRQCLTGRAAARHLLRPALSPPARSGRGNSRGYRVLGPPIHDLQTGTGLPAVAFQSGTMSGVNQAPVLR